MKKKDMSEINQLKVDLRNKTTMYENQKKITNELKKSNKLLTQKVELLEKTIELLQEKIKSQDYQIIQLKDEINKLKKNSTNSSKPPSTDIVKKNQSLRGKSGKKSGGQKGHKGCCKNQTNNPDKIIQCKPDICPFCGGKISDDSVFKELGKKQVIDIPEIKSTVTEYRLMGTKCKCGKKVKGEYPKDVNGPVNYGNNLQAFVGYLNIKHSLPYKRLSNIFSDILGVNMSEGTIDNILAKLSEKTKLYTEEIMKIIKQGIWVGSDETGTRVEGKNWYCWTWQNYLGTYYYSIKSRAYEVVRTTFGEDYLGTIIHDCFGAQNNTIAGFHQLCHPHLLRDLIFCVEKEKSAWAVGMIDLLLKSEKARDIIWENGFNEDIRKQVQQNYINKLDKMLEKAPKTKEALRLYKRFKKYRDWIFTFMQFTDIPHHNNSSEQAMRIHKVKKKISGGFRSAQGIKRHDIILSFIDTMRKQNRDILQSLKDVIEGKFYFCLS